MSYYKLAFLLLLFCSSLWLHGNDTETSIVIEQSVQLTNQDKYEAAIRLLQNHLTILKDGQPIAIAQVQHKLGVNYYYAYESIKALQAVSKAIELRRLQLGEDHSDTQKSLFLRSVIYRDLGKLEEARNDLERNIFYLETTDALSATERDSILMLRYDELGKLLVVSKDYYNAIYYWEQVKNYSIEKYGVDDLRVYQVEDQLAVAYKNIEQYDIAIEYFKKAIAFYERDAAQLPTELCIAYGNIGSTYAFMEQYDLAIDYFNRSLRSCAAADSRINQLDVYVILVEVYTKTGNFHAAQAAFDKGLALSAQLPATLFDAELYANLGLLAFTQKQYDLALQHYETAIQILVPNFQPTPEMLNPNPVNYNIQSKYDLLTTLTRKAAALTQKGITENNLSELKKALQCYSDVDLLMTDIRLDYQIGQSKFQLLKSNSAWYEKAIAAALLLYEKTSDPIYQAQAYQFNAKNKSIVLRDALQDESAKAFAGIPTAILEQEKNWKKTIHDTETALYELPSNATTDLKLYQDSLFQLKQAYKNFILQLEQQYPAYYELKYAFAQTPELAAIQAKLDPSSLLLEYFLGEEKAYVFAITQEDFKVFEIPNAPQLLENLQRFRISPTENQSTTKNKSAYLSLAYQHYKQLLAPALENFPSAQRLILIPDNELALIAFESFLTAPNEKLNSDTPFLLKQYAISYLYSSSFLFLSPKEKKATERFGGFGIEYDENTLNSLQKTQHPTKAVTRAVVRSMGQLKYSDDETLAIGKLLNGQVWLNEAATKSAFLENAARFRILHLAMHGLLDEKRPLQSALIFTKDSTSNHLLRAGELYNLDLQAELVVLSACNTGIGQVNKGEGVRSLARAFQYAGASSLVASLWSAPDQSTKELATSFYQYLQKGLSKDQALRQAKLDYLQNPNTSPEYLHPSYWAHLVVLGDRSALNLGDDFALFNYWWLLLGILLLVAYFYISS